MNENTQNGAVKKPLYKKWWVWVIVGLVVIGIIGGSGDKPDTSGSETVAEASPAPSSTPAPSPSPTLSPEEQAALDAQEKSDFIASCQNYTYEQVARDPDAYMYMPAHFKGKVTQIIEGSGFNVLMVSVTLGNYDLWSDTVYVQYTAPEGTSRILEDDVVDMYGSMAGLQTYTTVLGAEKTIPAMLAYYVDLT